MNKIKSILTNPWLRLIPAVVILFISIGFVSKKQNGKSLQKIYIDIENQFDNYYINEEDVMNLLTLNKREELIGLDMSELNLRLLESRVRKSPFVRKVIAYKDLKGNLIINIKQRRPLARFLRGGSSDYYLTDDAQVVPVSSRYSSHVPMIGGSFAKKINEGDFMKNADGNAIFELLKYIQDSEFWSAQIAEIDIDSQSQVTFYPQVGKHVISFGKPENIEMKFKKLSIFYEEIIPRKGWNAYQKISLKYSNQIVCE